MLKSKLSNTAFLLILIFLFVGQIAFAQTTGSETTTIDGIIKEAKRVNCPTIEYQVSVTQRLENVKYGPVQVDVPRHEGKAVYSPNKGLKRMDDTEGRPKSSAIIPKIMVDIGTYIAAMETYPTRTLAREEIAGRTHYMIRGSTENVEQECILWVDTENFSVSRVHLFVQQKPFAEIDVRSTLQKSEYWLPERITLLHATDNSTVFLDFSGYEFKE